MLLHMRSFVLVFGLVWFGFVWFRLVWFGLIFVLFVFVSLFCFFFLFLGIVGVAEHILSGF